MAWTVAAALSTPTVAPGNVIEITLTLTSDADVTALVDLELYHQLGDKWSKIYQRVWESERFSAGAARQITAPVTIPIVTRPGPCVVKVGLFNPGWAGVLHWVDGAAQFDIAGPSLEVAVAARAEPATIKPGQAVTITADITPTMSGTILVDLEVYLGMGGGWTKIHQQHWDGQAAVAGQTQTFSTVWTTPADLLQSEGVVKVGVFGPNWQGIAAWIDGAAGVRIDGPVLQAAGAIQLSADRVGPGQPIQVAAQVTANLDRPVWIVVRAADAKGQPIFGSVQPVSRLQTDQPWTAQLDWAGPYRDGTYTLGLELYSPGGQLRYGQLDQLARLTVDRQARHPAITIVGSERFRLELWAALDRLQTAQPALYARVTEIRQGLYARPIMPGVLEVPIWSLYSQPLLDRLLAASL